MDILILWVIPYGSLVLFLLRVIQYIVSNKNNGFKNANHQFLDNIPSIFTTLGIFGTFLGIVYGLWDFDSDNIDKSIPELLGGLRTAFMTSIFGLVLSLLFKAIIDYLRNNADALNTEPIDDELNALKLIFESLQTLNKSLIGKSDDSLATEIIKLRSQLRDQHKDTLKGFAQLREDQLKIAKDTLDANSLIVESLGGNGETSLLSQLIRFREDANENTEQQLAAVKSIESSMSDNTKLMAGKFDEFSDLLEKSNTDALVKAIENVMGDFNKKFNELISKLVQENFAELNDSVKRLNDWQNEYKNAVTILITQLKEASGHLQNSSVLMEGISVSTDKLTNNDGKLAVLVQEIESVVVKEGLFRDSVENLNQSTKDLYSSSENFQEWSKTERDLVDEVSSLIQNLKEIENLRDQSGEFWSDVKENLKESTNIIGEGNKDLMRNIENLEDSFNNRMDSSFRSLDKVLQAMVIKYKEEATNFLQAKNY